MILYLLQLTFLWSIFSLVYHFILSKKNIYVFNRFYLLLTFVGSLLIPLIPFNLLLKKIDSFQLVSSNNVNVLSEVVVDISNKTDYYSLGYTDMLWIVYSLGVISFMIYFIIGLIKILKLKNKSYKKVIEGIKVCKILQESQAFSFFKTVFLNETIFDNLKDNKVIWIHEKEHVKQFHSLDVLLVEIMKIFFWFHPLTYLYIKNIKMNHEYLADEEVLKKTINVRDYQHKLIDHIEETNMVLASTFNYRLTQKRIIMMTIKTKKQTKLAAKLFTFFAVAGILTIVACTNKEELQHGSKSTKNDLPYAEIQIEEKVSSADDNSEKALQLVQQKAKPSEGIQTFYNEFIRKFNLPKDPLLNTNNEIKIKLNFIIEKDGSFSEILGTSESSKILVDEAIRVLKTMPKWIPAEHEGKIVRSTFTLPIKIRVNL